MLAALGVTDGLDGYVARHFHQVTSLGKLADPFVDGAVAIGAVPWWLVAIVLLREALVLAGAVVLAMGGARHLDVSLAGKAGAFGMMVALPLFLLGHAPFRWHELADGAAWVAVACGQVFAWYGAVQYIPTGRALLAEARKGQGDGRDGHLVAPSGDGHS
jgi:cardiolipin synthase